MKKKLSKHLASFSKLWWVFYLLSLVLFLVSGCSLIPKRVELFQDKVRPFPEATTRQKETERQAAWRAKEKAIETANAALSTGASTNVVAPALETEKLTDAVSTSLGPPATQSKLTSDELAVKLLATVAKLDRKIDAFKQDNNENAGKKIEGTGLIQVPYFIYLGGFIVVAVIGWHLAKLALAAASVANPGAAVGLGVMNVTGAVAGKGLSQVVNGGKNFLKWVGENVESPEVKQKITDAFLASHKQAQDQDVRLVVDRLTK